MPKLDYCAMAEPLSWPYFPVLPVKLRNGSPFDQDACGVIFAKRPATPMPVVHILNIYECSRLTKDIAADPEIKHIVYESFEELQKHWTID